MIETTTTSTDATSSEVHILIVDDDTALLQALPEALRLRMGNLQITTCDSAKEALDQAASHDYDAIVSDIKMPGMDGLALLQRLHTLRPETPVLLITGHGERDLAVQALRGGAFDFVMKPIEREYFVASLYRAIQVRQLRRQVEQQQRTLEAHARSLEEAVTERTHELAEANAAKDVLLLARDRALEDADRTRQRIAFLAEASTLLASSLDSRAVLTTLTHLVVPRIADWCMVDMVDDDGALRRLALAHSVPANEHLIRQMPTTEGSAEVHEQTYHVVRTMRSILIPEVDHALLEAGAIDARHLRLMEQLDIRSYMCVPMIVRDQAIGAITFVGTGPRRFSEEDVALAEDLARRAANSADNAHLYAAAQQAATEQRLARKQAEDLARLQGHQAAELTAIIDSMADSVRVCDAETRLVRMNRKAVELIGISPEQLPMPLEQVQERALLRYPDGTVLPLEELPLMRALRGEVGNDARHIVRLSDGREVRLRASFAPIRDAEGKITGAVVVERDVTELERLQHQKDEFLSIASHELKTPLTSLKGLTQLTRRRLERANLPIETHLGRMEQSIVRMERLINDLLDVSRLESGKMALTLDRCDTTALCEQVADEQTAATEREIVLDVPEAPVIAMLDADRIHQVLTNLLSNAIKYSPPESLITIELNEVDDNLLLVVRDEGGGIPAEELPQIFDRFYRVPGIQVQSGSTVGLGLGLYICREIVERHGGCIWAESAPSQGTAFFVSLPLGIASSPRRAPHDASATARS